MNINIKQVSIIIFISLFLSSIRYFLLIEDYDFIKKPRLNQIEENLNYSLTDSLKTFVYNNSSLQLVDITLSKSLYDNNLVTFIDARDVEAYNKEHIKGSLNIPFDYIEDIVNNHDLQLLLELEEDFIEIIKVEDNNPFIFGIQDKDIFITSNKGFSLNQIKKNKMVFLIYCSGEGCSLSEDLGLYFSDVLNIKNIFVYEGGIPEWVENNYPTESNE